MACYEAKHLFMFCVHCSNCADTACQEKGFKGQIGAPLTRLCINTWLNSSTTVRFHGCLNTAHFPHECLHSDQWQVCALQWVLCFCLIMPRLVQPIETTQTGLRGEHRGQGNNSSEPSPEQCSSVGLLSHSSLGLPLGTGLGVEDRPPAVYWHHQNKSHFHHVGDGGCQLLQDKLDR